MSANIVLAEQPIFLYDNKGNSTGTIQKLQNSNMYVKTDKYGRQTHTYKVIGSWVYVFDKYGRCIESYYIGKEVN